MQTLTINIKNETITKKLLSMLDHFKSDDVEIILNNDDQNLKIDPYFYERKERLHHLRDDIRSGKEKMYDSDEFEKDMDKFEEELILKYGN